MYIVGTWLPGKRGGSGWAFVDVAWDLLALGEKGLEEEAKTKGKDVMSEALD